MGILRQEQHYSLSYLTTSGDTFHGPSQGVKERGQCCWHLCGVTWVLLNKAQKPEMQGSADLNCQCGTELENSDLNHRVSRIQN